MINRVCVACSELSCLLHAGGVGRGVTEDGEQQHGQHRSGQEAGGAAEDGGQHGQDQGEGSDESHA